MVKDEADFATWVSDVMYLTCFSPYLPIGSLQRVVTYYPKILTVPVKTIKNVVAFLRERCLFTVQQVTDILRFSPAVVLEDHDQLEYKFQVRKQSRQTK